MKYIRTKNGIWLFGGTHAKGKVIIGKKKETYFDFCFVKKDIIKQADTIEELCDEFVRVSKSVHDFLVSNDIPTKKFDDTEIYGAIWTDKGLIYVAKLNDKGEWELI